METNNFRFNKYEVIHCSTEELTVEVLKIAHNKGYKWCTNISFMEINYWSRHKENTCLYIHEGQYSNLDLYKRRNYKVISAEDFLKQHNKNINNHKPYLIWN